MSFIREHIKEKPINKKRIFINIGVAALCGLVFAIVVCVILVFFVPAFKEHIIAENESSQMKIQNQTEAQTETESTEEEDNEIVIPPNLNLSISDYQTLQDELYKIGNEVNKSIVAVTGVASDTEWLENAFETEGQGSGVIVAEDENYLYILTEKKIISEATRIRVSFVDGASADATLLKADENTDIAILTVAKRQLNSSTKKSIAIVALGNSTEVTNGAIVIALGSPLGTNYSILTGNITSVQNEIVTQDKNYSVFTTDIVGSETGSGILINTKGEIVGVVMQSFSGSQDVGTLTAVAIDELREIIELLINGKDVPYVGLYISTVTEDISKNYEIPMGVYIKEIAAGSPAMHAGLQSGDVIVAINGEAVASDIEYSDKISQLIPGTSCEITVQRQSGDEYYEVTYEVEIGVLE